MKINVEYDWWDQSANICGPFIFYRDEDGIIKNLEARF